MTLMVVNYVAIVVDVRTATISSLHYGVSTTLLLDELAGQYVFLKALQSRHSSSRKGIVLWPV